MEVCKNWYNIIGSEIQKSVILNRSFLDFDGQKRSLQFIKLLSSPNSFFINHIKEITIYDNFFFNSTMLNIVKKCLNLEKLTLIYSTTSVLRNEFKCRIRMNTPYTILFDNNYRVMNFEKNFLKNLIDSYERIGVTCFKCDEPIYWGKFIYWHYCSKHKSSNYRQTEGIVISSLKND